MSGLFQLVSFSTPKLLRNNLNRFDPQNIHLIKLWSTMEQTVSLLKKTKWFYIASRSFFHSGTTTSKFASSGVVRVIQESPKNELSKITYSGVVL